MNKVCLNCKKEFKITESENNVYKKVGISSSNLCFVCRVAGQFAFWNFGKFRIGKSDYSKKQIITTYQEDTRFPIYTTEEWHSDVWDGTDYGIWYSSKKSFFEQLKELQEKVPHPHSMGTKNINCEWSDDTWNSKNCYLSRSVDGSEDISYGYRVLNSKNCIDVTFAYDLENCYDCTYCFKSYNLKYSINSKDCFDSYFLYDCRNCSNCFMSSNLRGKSYCINNIQYTKEEYFKKLADWNLLSREVVNKLKADYVDLIKNNTIHRENLNLSTTNSTGNFISNMNNCANCFSYSESQDIYNAVRGLKSNTTIDANGCWRVELIGNCMGCVDAYALKHSVWSSSRYSEYLEICEECEYCFGCVGLKKKKYCILNKQYSKENYEVLKEKIISDMQLSGEYEKFFPYNMALVPYNLSTASLYVPKTKQEVLSLGGYWFDGELTQINGEVSSNIPDILLNASDDIVTRAFICSASGFRFSISSNELLFYKKWGIPLPSTHFDVRTRERLSILTSIELNEYQCFFCNKKIQISYKPEWGYTKIACEDCYKREVL